MWVKGVSAQWASGKLDCAYRVVHCMQSNNIAEGSPAFVLPDSTSAPLAANRDSSGQDFGMSESFASPQWLLPGKRLRSTEGRGDGYGVKEGAKSSG